MSEFKLSEWVNDFGRYTERKCIPTEKVKEFIRLSGEFSEEEGKNVICRDDFQEGFEYAIHKMKKLAGEELLKDE